MPDRPVLRLASAMRDKLRVWGVSRDAENPKAVLVSFNRKLSDAELRFFHEVCERSAPLMEDE